MYTLKYHVRHSFREHSTRMQRSLIGLLRRKWVYISLAWNRLTIDFMQRHYKFDSQCAYAPAAGVGVATISGQDA